MEASGAASRGDESESDHDGQDPETPPPNSSRAARSLDLEDEEEANGEEIIVPSIACQLLPHGLYVFLPATVALMAWLATLSADDCDLAKVTGDAVAELTGNPGATELINS